MIWCYGVDKGKWGQQIVQTAADRGMDARLFDENVDPDVFREGDYVFMRLPQWEPELTVGKYLASEIFKRGVRFIPDFFTLMSYEDKLMQARAYWDWMPKTHVIEGPCSLGESIIAVNNLGVPFVSKSKEASASANVRLIRTPEEAAKEFMTVMKGDGLDIKIGKGRLGKQKGYLIWQRFCDGNECDYRAVITGRHIMLLRRFNKPGTPFASGSGHNEPVKEIDSLSLQRVLGTARAFFDRFNLKWNGIDLVYDPAYDEWKILETTLGWSQAAYQDCVYFGTDYRGADIFKVLLDEIAAGVFDA